MRDIKILFEDNDFLVCIKPYGVSSEIDNGKGLPELLGVAEPLFTVHRLDKSVSGVMVYTKTKASAAYISKQISNKQFSKEYLAVVEGEIDEQAKFEDLLFHDRRLNKTFVVNRKRAGVKEAVLTFKKMASVKYCENVLSLVKVTLETGRTHQIRVQFASRKTPLVGDAKYGSKIKSKIALFSHKISFMNFDGKQCEYKYFPNCEFPWNEFNF